MKKLLFLSLLVLFSCSKGEEEEEIEVNVPTPILGVFALDHQIQSVGPHPLGSSPWLFQAYFTDTDKIHLGTSGINYLNRVTSMTNIECFTTWNFTVPETPEGYEFAGITIQPEAENVLEVAVYPNYTKKLNCIGQPMGWFNDSSKITRVDVQVLWIYTGN